MKTEEIMMRMGYRKQEDLWIKPIGTSALIYYENNNELILFSGNDLNGSPMIWDSHKFTEDLEINDLKYAEATMKGYHYRQYEIDFSFLDSIQYFGGLL